MREADVRTHKERQEEGVERKADIQDKMDRERGKKPVYGRKDKHNV